MSSPEPVLTPTPAGTRLVSLGIAPVARSADAVTRPRFSPKAANEEVLPDPLTARRHAETDAPVRVPLSAWLSLAFYAIGTALLFSLGVAYRLFA
ncbi:hypothetical protein [Achromobacter spanius]|uniref:Uncharacterized protein n=1 Tax=Achromobacter spanius TaxID=217203 RepID=A0A2S0I856_9BURK|nr:hypothetical protein [Achromobacter spanius]AVJ28188.1 hypothetical protein CLM73_14300 [Achromobacter spanius]